MTEKVNRKLSSVIQSQSEIDANDFDSKNKTEDRQLDNHFYQDYQNKMKSIKQLLQIEYAYVYHQANKCLLKKCYTNIYTQPENVKSCVQECLNEAQPKNNQALDIIHEEFASCVKNSNQNSFFIETVFSCYDVLNKKIDNIPFNVKTDFATM